MLDLLLDGLATVVTETSSRTVLTFKIAAMQIDWTSR